MKLELIRKWFTEESTIGYLYIDGSFECFTLEDKVRPYPEKVRGQTAIWVGVYNVVIDYSNRFGKNMPHILDVPLFDGIRIHSGNTDEDTEGCILVGTKKGDDVVYHSRIAFNNLFKKLKEAKEITLTIKEET